MLFGDVPDEVPEAAFRILEREVGTTDVPRSDLEAGIDLARLLHQTGLTPSSSEGRRSLSQGGVYVNGGRPGEPLVSLADLRHDRWVLLRRGRRHHHLLRVVD